MADSSKSHSKKESKVSKRANRLGPYELGKELGRGAYAKVMQAQHTETGEEVAVKIIDRRLIKKRGMIDQFRREVAVLLNMKHENCVALKSMLMSKTKYFVVMDLTPGGDLFDLLNGHKGRGRLSEPEAIHYLKQILEGIAYCHKSGICHRDIKPENILVNPATRELRITDFGLAANPGTDKVCGVDFGTPQYAAPELLDREWSTPFDFYAADMWSIGVTLYVMLAGMLPFGEQASLATRRGVRRGSINFPSWFSAEAKDFITNLLHEDPCKRPTAARLRRHPWLQSSPTASSDVSEESSADEEHATVHRLASTNLSSVSSSGSGSGSGSGCGDSLGSGVDEPEPLRSTTDTISHRSRSGSEDSLATVGSADSDGSMDEFLAFKSTAAHRAPKPKPVRRCDFVLSLPAAEAPAFIAASLSSPNCLADVNKEGSVVVQFKDSDCTVSLQTWAVASVTGVAFTPLTVESPEQFACVCSNLTASLQFFVAQR